MGKKKHAKKGKNEDDEGETFVLSAGLIDDDMDLVHTLSTADIEHTAHDAAESDSHLEPPEIEQPLPPASPKKSKKKSANGASVGRSTDETGARNVGEDVVMAEPDVEDAEADVAKPDAAGPPAKKRRKVEFALSPEHAKEASSPPPEHDLDASVEHPLSGFLPVLPEPSEPEPPTRSQLYLQSLDKALARARIIDSSTTALLDVSDAVEDAKDEFGLSLDMRRRLSAQGITHLFAVQTALFPFLLSEPGVVNQLYRHYDPPRDVCVSAPTGSGKTLAYVVPILEILSAKVVTRLRALIVLPTQELVHQVYETIQPLAKGRHLHIAMVTGQRSFAHEQSTLVQESKRPLKGGSSKIDILICTPGRLVDHITSTPNFTLQHLRFLVIDEADRLISGSFQSWLPRVLDAIHTPPTHINDTTHSTLPYHDAVAPHLRTLSSIRITTSLDESRQSSCQKLLLSATLTQDPSKIAALKLRNPQYIVIKSTTHDTSLDGEHDEMIFDGTAALPDTLREHYLAMDTSEKPLYLFYLIHVLHVTHALVFTKSTDSTNRLVRLIQFFEDIRLQGNACPYGGAPTRLVARAFSSELNQAERRSILGQFKEGKIDILVCSDLVGRGIDIVGIPHVVSYDAPPDMTKYVHRVGRTARAGREGDAWSLVESQEAAHFKSFLKENGRWKGVKRWHLKEKQLAPLQDHYRAALQALKASYTSS